MKYEDLLIEADKNNLITKEKPLPISKGRIKGNRIAIRTGMTETEKACVLAEELGHYHTSVGNILDMNNTQNQKQELVARMWGYNRLIGLYGIIDCYRAGCQNIYEMAEYLDVTEEFLSEALERYRQKFGKCVRFDNYVIYFEPSLKVEDFPKSDVQQIEAEAHGVTIPDTAEHIPADRFRKRLEQIRREKARIQRELQKREREIEVLIRMHGNEDFLFDAAEQHRFFGCLD